MHALQFNNEHGHYELKLCSFIVPSQNDMMASGSVETTRDSPNAIQKASINETKLNQFSRTCQLMRSCSCKHGRQQGGAKRAFATLLEIGTEKQKFLKNVKSAV